MAKRAKVTPFKSVRAGDIKVGDKLQYRGEGLIRVSTVDRYEHIWGKKYPDSIHLQIEHPKRGRISWGLSAADTVELLEDTPQEEEDFWETFSDAITEATEEDIADWLGTPSKQSKPRKLSSESAIPNYAVRNRKSPKVKKGKRSR